MRVDIRERMVGHLRNIDEKLAKTVAAGLGLPKMPPAMPAAVAPLTDLPPSDALSIVKRGPGSFAGRKLGILVTDGAPVALLDALTAAVEALPATWELSTPKIGGAMLDDQTLVQGKQKLDGGPSVLYDAVALLVSAGGAAMLARDAAARDSSRTHSRTANSSGSPPMRLPCCKRPALRAKISTKRASGWRQRGTPPASWRAARRCVSGRAS